MNHCISAACSAFDKVDGWNSSSIHFFAAAVSAIAEDVPAIATAAATADKRYVRILYPPYFKAP